MREGISRLIGALGVVITLTAAPAFGQVPVPKETDIQQRSGLLTRIIPIEPHLPPDPYRDSFYDTRFDDQPTRKHPNGIKGGGLYGLPWKAKCTMSIYPFFFGAPGQNTVGPECRRWWRPARVVQTFVQPFRPVGMYYDQGSYVPIYDLDPIVPGPGPYPIPWYLGGPHGF